MNKQKCGRLKFETVDIALTLSDYLNIKMPSGSSGRPMAELPEKHSLLLENKSNDRKNMNAKFQVLLIVMILFISACNTNKKKDTQTYLNPKDAKSLAKEAWLFYMLLVMFEIQFEYNSYITK